ncbi:hypothetical protein [Aestuariivivens sediminicola]|uniref:hypothetical protein n=1 Tax=Aestuariivivens sediminicola TaxID=2913560 RepID=UPI001F58E26E|nr:hypothetical protein [Aestuariivivens sediminicola]
MPLKKIKQITGLFFFMGALGVLLKVYAGFYNSGIYSSDNIFEQRLQNMGKELTGGAVGAFSSMLYPFAFLALLLAIYHFKSFKKVSLLTISFFGIYPIIETFFMGGRTTIALLGTTLLFVTFASYLKNTAFPVLKFKILKIKLLTLPKFLLKRKIIIPLITVVILFIYYSISVLDNRLTRFNYGDGVFIVWERKDYKWVKFDDEFKEEYFKYSAKDKAKTLGLLNLKHYFVHGVFEFVRLVNDLDKVSGYYYGQYQFNVFFKFFKMLGLPLKSFGELSTIVKRQAVYQTFWGPFYIDFGIFGIVIAFFWGRFVKRVYIKAKMGSTPHVIFYGYLATVIVTSFYINFLMGSSSYFLFAFLISLAVFKYWPPNLKFVADWEQ